MLRTWENRFGFPAGIRSPSGHRRFSDADVDLVREVQDLARPDSGAADADRLWLRALARLDQAR